MQNTDEDRRGNAAGRATRQLIVLTAERLFAEKGIDAVSLREIGQAAGQGNVAAVQFHFESKKGLLQAIVEYRAPQTDARRADLLDELEERGTPPSIQDLMRALILPVAEHVDDPNDRYVSFQASLKVVGSTYGHPVAHTAQSRALTRLQTLMAAALPTCPPSVLDRRLAMVIDWMVQSLATYEKSAISHVSVMPLQTAVQDLVEVLSSALLARPV